MDWLTTKQTILDQLADHIADLGNTEPVPFQTIERLEAIEAKIQTANESEFTREGYQAWWASYPH